MAGNIHPAGKKKWQGNRTPEYWDHLVAHAKGKNIVLIHQGNQHYSGFFVAGNPMIDIVDDADPPETPDPETLLVPRRLMKAYFGQTIDYSLTVLAERLHAAGCNSISVVGTPAPKNDISVLISTGPAGGFIAEFARRRNLDLETIRFTSPDILLRMWTMIQELMRETAGRIGARFIPVPPRSLDPDGFLRTEFYEDITHANMDYGQLLLGWVLKELEGGQNDKSV